MEEGYYEQHYSKKVSFSEKEHAFLIDHYGMLVLDTLITCEEKPRFFEDFEGLNGWLYFNDPLAKMAFDEFTKTVDSLKKTSLETENKKVSKETVLRSYKNLKEDSFKTVMQVKQKRAKALALAKGYNTDFFDEFWKQLPAFIPGNLKDSELVEITYLIMKIFYLGKDGYTDIIESQDCNETISMLIPQDIKNHLDDDEINVLVFILSKAHLEGLVIGIRTIRNSTKIAKSVTSDPIERLILASNTLNIELGYGIFPTKFTIPDKIKIYFED